MNRMTSIKIALIVIAGVFLVAGMRADNPIMRWIGIAFLAAAFALRFFKKDSAA
jgi:hypothetical protein